MAVGDSGPAAACRAPSRRRRVLAARVAGLTCLVALAGCGARGGPGDACPPGAAQDLLREINRVRAADGARPVSVDLRLVDAATGHARELARGEASGHVGRDGSSPGTRARRAAYPWGRVGETVASGFRTAREVVEGWLASEPHRAVLLDSRYRDVGVGTAGRDGDRVWVALFGTALEHPERPRRRCHPVG